MLKFWVSSFYKFDESCAPDTNVQDAEERGGERGVQRGDGGRDARERALGQALQHAHHPLPRRTAKASGWTSSSERGARKRGAMGGWSRYHSPTILDSRFRRILNGRCVWR